MLFWTSRFPTMIRAPKLHRWCHALLVATFVASGFSALLYQTIWQRLLGFFSGADVYSATFTVAAFMGGLGFGSLLGGHLADQASPRTSLRLFAAAELAIAAFAALSVPVLYQFLYLRLGPHFDSPWAIGLVLFLTLLWPTFFMGVSLPLLSKALVSDLSAAARGVSLLYGFNTIGAAAGAVATLWVLARTFGFHAAIGLGVAINVSCAIVALLTASSLPRTRQPPDVSGGSATPEPDTERDRDLSLRHWLAIYLLSGFVALSLEILWFRLLGVVLKSNAFTFATMLGIFLLGLGLGSIVSLRWADRARDATQTFFWLQAGVGLHAGLAVTLLVIGVDRVNLLRPVWKYLGSYEAIEIGTALRSVQAVLLNPIGAPEGTRALAWTFSLLYLAIPAWLLLPPTFLMGASFTFLQRAVQDDVSRLGRRVGWLQTTNIVGSMAGAFLTGLVFLDRLGAASTLRVLVLCSTTFLGLGLWRARSSASRRRFAAALVLSPVIAWSSPDASRLWSTLHGTGRANIIFDEDGSGLSVLKRVPDRAGMAVFANGLGQSWLPFGGIHTVLGALPVLVHAHPESVVVIGLGSGDTVFAAAGRPETSRVQCIEIISCQLQSLRRPDVTMAYPGLSRLLSDPRIRFFNGDGRAYIMRSRERFDVIEADALRPNNAYAGNLYSHEYFDLLRSRLKPGGIAVTWAPTPRIRDTFLSVFPHVVAFPGVLLGSDRPIPFQTEELERRLDEPRWQSHFREADVDIRTLLTPFLKESPRVFAPGAGRPQLDLNSDLFPRDEFLTPRQ